MSKWCKAKSEGQQWHYLAVKKLSALLRGVMSKYYSDFYSLDCILSLEQKANLNRIGKLCENEEFCHEFVPSEDIKEFNQNQKSAKASFIIYADLECIIEKINGCKNSSETSSAIKVSGHIPSGFSISTITAVRKTENKHNVCRSKDWMKNF